MTPPNAVDIIEMKKSQAMKYSHENGGWLNRKQFAEIAEVHVSKISKIINSPDFGEIIRKVTPGEKGPVKIPLETALQYIEKTFKVE